MKKIFIVGSVNTDLVITASRFPEQGETVSGGDFFIARGGKGANQAVACARAGGKVYFCGCVGDDDFGKEAHRFLSKEGINTSHLRAVPSCPTGTAIIVITNGNNRIIVDKGANDHVSKEDIDAFLSEAVEGDIFLTQAENPIEIIGYGLKKAREKKLYTILNPAPASEDILPYLSYCDLIVPNETEAEILGGSEHLLTLVPTIITTLGEKGFSIATKEANKTYLCKKIIPVDTTAAGDTFCGGLSARLASGDNLEQSALFGSAAATLACTKKGAQPSIPYLKEISDYLNL